MMTKKEALLILAAVAIAALPLIGTMMLGDLLISFEGEPGIEKRTQEIYLSDEFIVISSGSPGKVYHGRHGG